MVIYYVNNYFICTCTYFFVTFCDGSPMCVLSSKEEEREERNHLLWWKKRKLYNRNNMWNISPLKLLWRLSVLFESQDGYFLYVQPWFGSSWDHLPKKFSERLECRLRMISPLNSNDPHFTVNNSDVIKCVKHLSNIQTWTILWYRQQILQWK